MGKESMSFLDWLNMETIYKGITKKKFGEIMHDPYATEEEKKRALKALEYAEGYENLPD